MANIRMIGKRKPIPPVADPAWKSARLMMVAIMIFVATAPTYRDAKLSRRIKHRLPGPKGNASALALCHCPVGVSLLDRISFERWA